MSLKVYFILFLSLSYISSAQLEEEIISYTLDNSTGWTEDCANNDIKWDVYITKLGGDAVKMEDTCSISRKISIAGYHSIRFEIG